MMPAVRRPCAPGAACDSGVPGSTPSAAATRGGAGSARTLRSATPGSSPIAAIIDDDGEVAARGRCAAPAAGDVRAGAVQRADEAVLLEQR